MRCETIENEARDMMVEFSGYYKGMPSDYAITKDSYSRFVNRAAVLLGVPTELLYYSGISLIGQESTYENLYRPIYFWLANKSEFLEGKAIPLSGHHTIPQDVEVQFVGSEYIGDTHVGVYVQFLTGTVALRYTRWKLTLRQASCWCKSMGYSYKAYSKFTMPDIPIAFPGLFGMIHLKHKDKKTSHALEDFDPWAISDASVTTRNHRILNIRNGYKECPYGLSDKIRDFENYCAIWCLKGWKNCECSGHKNDYILGHCDMCNRDRRPLAVEGGICVECSRESE